jgi:transcriptional regulator with XRE-family HTH domain
MSQGYSLRICNMNEKADPGSPGVRLGKLCIAQDIPVSVVAKAMGVSRATVYNWFSGVSAPQANAISRIESYIASLS